METIAPPDGLLDGRWEAGPILGRGAAADVFRGADLTTGHPVAIKVLRAIDDGSGRRFEREIAALEQLDHPGIVGVLGHGATADGRPYVVMERALGGTLAGLLAAGPMAVDEVAVLGVTLAEALAHAHARGVVHRDVKPDNVLLDGEGRGKLADFGIARVVGSATVTATGWAVGTPAYLAPEQLRGDGVGPPADVYSLGLVLLEATTGVRAFAGEGMAAAMARLHGGPTIPDSVPAGLAAALAAMTVDDPALRPSAAEVASRLAMLVDAGSTVALPVADLATTAIEVEPAPTPPAVPPAVLVPMVAAAAGRPRWRRPTVAALCFVLGFLGVSAARAFLDGGDPAEPVGTVATTTSAVQSTTTAPSTTSTTEVQAHGRDKPGHGHGHDD